MVRLVAEVGMAWLLVSSLVGLALARLIGRGVSA
jgi:hypothetical protein